MPILVFFEASENFAMTSIRAKQNHISLTKCQYFYSISLQSCKCCMWRRIDVGILLANVFRLLDRYLFLGGVFLGTFMDYLWHLMSSKPAGSLRTYSCFYPFLVRISSVCFCVPFLLLLYLESTNVLLN